MAESATRKRGAVGVSGVRGAALGAVSRERDLMSAGGGETALGEGEMGAIFWRGEGNGAICGGGTAFCVRRGGKLGARKMGDGAGFWGSRSSGSRATAARRGAGVATGATLEVA